MAKSKRPKDTNQLAKNILDIATGESEDTPSKEEVKSAAQALGRLGGLKGGKARAKVLSAAIQKILQEKLFLMKTALK